jgi:hypothetical protein
MNAIIAEIIEEIKTLFVISFENEIEPKNYKHPVKTNN